MMNSKYAFTIGMALITAAMLAGCGKTEAEPAETEPSIKVREQVLTTTAPETEAPSESTEAESTEADTEAGTTLRYESGIELATLKINGEEHVVKTGDVIANTLIDNGLQHISWSTFHTENQLFTYTGRGYALHDVSKEADLPEDYEPLYISFELTDEDGNVTTIEDTGSANCHVAGVMATYDDETTDDFVVEFEGGITTGMTREEIEKALGQTGGDDDSLYVVDKKLAIYVKYSSLNGKAEEIFALPLTATEYRDVDVMDD